MSEGDAPIDPSMAQPGDQPITARVLPDHDWFLVHLVELASDGVSIGVTLHVGGLIISGEMISGKSYFEEFSSKLLGASYAGHDPEENKNFLAEGFKSLTAIYDRPEDAPEDWQPPRPAFVHLRGARVFSAAGSPIPQEGALWRGRITAVDAFSLGSLSQNRS